MTAGDDALALHALAQEAGLRPLTLAGRTVLPVVQGGKLLCEHQLVQRKLFDMFTKVESARALSRAVAAYNSVTIPPLSRLGIASKVYSTQVAFEVASDAVQLFGGYGLSKEFLIEKLFRDARASMIEDGSNDVLALAAARSILDNWV